VAEQTTGGAGLGGERKGHGGAGIGRRSGHGDGGRPPPG
jgi:hypothetical protein